MKLVDKLLNLGYEGFGVLAVDAGEVALEYGISREMQDEWAVRSGCYRDFCFHAL